MFPMDMKIVAQEFVDDLNMKVFYQIALLAEANSDMTLSAYESKVWGDLYKSLRELFDAYGFADEFHKYEEKDFFDIDLISTWRKK